MNRYPLWKYLLLLGVLAVACIFALPNLYAPDPAIQITPQSSAAELNPAVLTLSLIHI